MSKLKITVGPTERVKQLTSSPVRLWQGVTEGGIEVDMLVAYVTVRNPADMDRFRAEMDGLMPSRLDGGDVSPIPPSQEQPAPPQESQ